MTPEWDQVDFDQGYLDGMHDAAWPVDFPTPAYCEGRKLGTASRVTMTEESRNAA